MVFGEGEGAGDAADVVSAFGALGRGEFVVGDDVGDADAAAGGQDAEHLGEHGRLVGGQVDDAVGDDDVDRVRGQRDGLDRALEELDVGGSSLLLVGQGQRQHLLGHVQAVGLAGGADAAGGEEDVDAAAGAEVQDALSFMEVGDGGGVAAAERGGDGLGGQSVALVGGIEGGAEVVVDLDGLGPATGGAAFADLDGGRGIALADGLAQVGVLLAHDMTPRRRQAEPGSTVLTFLDATLRPESKTVNIDACRNESLWCSARTMPPGAARRC